jgi:esterase/lipase
MIRSDEKEYFEDYEKYYSQEESKPRNFGAPFVLDNPNSDIGVILSHGYKSSPEEVRVLASYLHKAGFNVYVVRLKGHGTAPENLRDTKWEDWYDSFAKGYAYFSHKCSKIVAVGFSTGGLLALLAASRFKNDIAAVVSINAAFKLNDIRVNLVPSINFWNELLDKVNIDKGKKEYIIDEPENPDINYSKNYLKAVGELSQLMDVCDKNLKNIVSPTLIVQGDKDPVVNPKSAKMIYNDISSAKKELHMVDFDNHVIIREENEALFEKIADFIYSNV